MNIFEKKQCAHEAVSPFNENKKQQLFSVSSMSRSTNWRRLNCKVEAIADTSSNETSEENVDNVQLESSSNEESEHFDYSFGSDESSESAQSENEASDDSDNCIDEPEETDLNCDLAEWSIADGISQSSLNNLLGVLRKHGIRLPKDARTLLKTPKTIENEEKAGGQYSYLGVESGICQLFRRDPGLHKNLDRIELKVNVDGAPLFKSTTVQLWPILCSFHTSVPFVVCLYSGQNKPSPVKDYLSDFMNEITELQRTGIDIGNKHYEVTIHSFICDAPARQMLKSTKGHTGYYSCERCQIKGYSSHHCTVFDTDQRENVRTDDEFNRGVYNVTTPEGISGHQLNVSPLIGFVSCVSQFVLDYMHLVCLGIVKRLIAYWKQGSKISKKGKLTYNQMNQISERLKNLRGKLPKEFARQPRTIFEAERWKATECRQFLLYTGPVVLKGILADDQYQHFLSLTVAMTILLNDDAEVRSRYIDYAQELLTYFVRRSKELYTELFISYNVHSVQHLVDDCRNFDCDLNAISSFEFENHLHNLKRKVRGSQKTVVQIAKRISESSALKIKRRRNRHVKFVSTKSSNNCFILDDGSYAFAKDYEENGNYMCIVVSPRNCEEIFREPLKSKPFGIVFCKYSHLRSGKRRLIHQSSFKRKVISMEYRNKSGRALFPMLHEFEGK